MRCPFCAHDDSQVKDSRPTEDNTAIRRRRQCNSCGARFTTFERVQLRDITVLKSGGPDGEERREAFDRSKIEQSVALACRKRGIAHWWVVVPSVFLVGLSLGLPLYLAMRESRT